MYRRMKLFQMKTLPCLTAFMIWIQSAKHGLLPMHRDFLTRLQKTEKLAAKKYTSYLPEHPTKWRVFFVVHFTEILLKSGVPIRSNGVLW